MQRSNRIGKADIAHDQYIDVGMVRLFAARDGTEYQCALYALGKGLQGIGQQCRHTGGFSQHAGKFSKDGTVTIGSIVHLIANGLPRQDADLGQLDQLAAGTARQGTDPAGEFPGVPSSVRVQKQGRQQTGAQRPEKEIS
jgi:hypothetical protein